MACHGCASPGSTRKRGRPPREPSAAANGRHAVARVDDEVEPPGVEFHRDHLVGLEGAHALGAGTYAGGGLELWRGRLTDCELGAVGIALRRGLGCRSGRSRRGCGRRGRRGCRRSAAIQERGQERGGDNSGHGQERTAAPHRQSPSESADCVILFHRASLRLPEGKPYVLAPARAPPASRACRPAGSARRPAPGSAHGRDRS